MDHVMVIPDHGPVRIGDAPTIETHGHDEAGLIRVDGVPQYIPMPTTEPHPIIGTPYDAYALGTFWGGEFAIRLREDTP